MGKYLLYLTLNAHFISCADAPFLYPHLDDLINLITIMLNEQLIKWRTYHESTTPVSLFKICKTICYDIL